MDATSFTFSAPSPSLSYSTLTPPPAPKKARRGPQRKARKASNNGRTNSEYPSCSQNGCPITSFHRADTYHANSLDAPLYVSPKQIHLLSRFQYLPKTPTKRCYWPGFCPQIKLLNSKLHYSSVSFDEFMLLEKFYAAHRFPAPGIIQRPNKANNTNGLERLIDARIEVALGAKTGNDGRDERSEKLLKMIRGQ